MRGILTRHSLPLTMSLGIVVIIWVIIQQRATISQASFMSPSRKVQVPSPVITPSAAIDLDEFSIIPASCQITSITQNYGGNGQPIISEDGQWVAFWSNANYDGKNSDGNIELFIAYLASQPIQLIQVTETTGNVASGFNLRPAINRSSSEVAFFSDQDPATGTSCQGSNSDKNFEIFKTRIALDDVNQATTDNCEQVTNSIGGHNLLPNFAQNGQIIFAQSSSQASGRLFNPTSITRRGDFIYLPIIYKNYRNSIATPTYSGTINPTPVPPSGSYNLAYYDPDKYPQLPVFNLPLLRDTQGVAAGGETILEPAIDFSERFIVFVSERNLTQEEDYQNAQQIFLYDLKNQQFIKISQNDNPNITVEHPAISRNGEKIVFIQDKKLFYVEQLSLDPLAYSDPQPIFTHGTVSEVTINAEGSRIIFTAADLPNHSKPDIYLYDLRNGGRHLLAVANALPNKWPDRSSSNPSISADGQTIVFASDNTRQVEVYLAQCGSANLSLEKMANRTVVPGDVMNYNFVIRNNDDATVSEVILEDELPDEVMFIPDVNQGCSARGQRVTCRIGQIGAKQQTSFAFQVQVGSDTPQGTVITNTARVYSGLPNGSLGNTAVATTTVIGAKALLGVQATWPGLIQVGTPITYQLTIFNDGPSVATNVTFDDVLPIAGQIIDPPNANCTVNGNLISCPLGTLTPTQVITLTLVTSPMMQATVVTNTITLNSLESPQVVIKTLKTEVIDKREQLYISIIEADPNPIPLNATLTYFMSIINAATQAARGVEVSYTIPPEGILVGGSVCGRDVLPQLNGQVLTFRVDELASGSTIDCKIAIQVTQLPPLDTLVSTIKVSSVNITGDSDTHQMTIDRSGDLRLVKASDARLVTSGTLFEYTLSIFNENPVPVQNVTLRDTLPNGLELMGVPTSPGITVTTQANSIVWDIPIIEEFGRQDYSIKVQVIDANAIANLLTPIITNTAVVEAAQDRYLVNNTASYSNVVVGTIGGHVWHDVNANGIQDTSELTVTSGLTLTIKLYNSLDKVVATQVSNNGVYEFSNVESGDYTLEFSVPRPFDQFSPTHQGSDDTLDNDVDSQTRRTKSFKLLPGSIQKHWDIGVYNYARIQTYIWEDMNGDGVQNEDSLAALNDVVVEVYTNAKASAVVSGGAVNGYYTATHLVPGTYYVKYIKPTNFAEFTWADVITDDTKDSDVDRVSGQTVTMTLVSGEFFTKTDAGLYRLGSIQNSSVFEDFDIDAIKDPRELRLPSVSVALLWQKPGTTAFVSFASASTNNDGFYSFTNLPPGLYKLEVDKLAGYEFSTAENNCRPVEKQNNNNIPTFLVKSNQNNIVCEAGLYQPVGGVGGTIIADMGPPSTNAGNGIQNTGEIGLAGVVVRIFDTTGKAITQTTTNSVGNYVFNNLVPGRYYFQFINPDPTKYVFSPPNQGGNPEIDCDGDMSTGTTNPFDLNPGQSDFSWDGCFQEMSSLKGLAWLDSNQNGIREDTENTYLTGVTVKLYNALGNLVTQTTTTATGYQFDRVTPGDYTLTFASAGGYLCSPANMADDTIDSDASGTPPCQTATFRLSPGETVTSWDVGMSLPSVLVAGRVWHDLNGDGIQNNGQNGLIEPGVPGTLVSLVSAANQQVVYSQTVNNNDGLFNFVNPATGNYYLEFTSPLTAYCYSPKKALGSDPSNDSDVNVPACGISTTKTDNFTVVANQIDTNWGAGMYQKTSISGYVWHETVEADGVKGATETDMPTSVTVRLLKSGVQVAQMDTQGAYAFPNLLPGSYQLQFGPPNVGTYQYSPPSTGNANIGPFALESSQVLTNQNKGYYQTSNIQVLVWDDKDADGQKDGNENGSLSINVPVTLYRNGVAVETVNIANSHTFLNLVPSQNYVLQFSEAGTYKLSPPPTSTGTISVTLGGGVVQQGYYQEVDLTGYVWLDSNGNGIKDNAEGDMPSNVTVTLHKPDNSTSAKNTKNSFTFASLIPSPGYWLEFDLPNSSFTYTLPITGRIDVTDFGASQNQGYLRLVDLEVQVWEDGNANGVINGSPGGVASVVMQLGSASMATRTYTTTGSFGGSNHIFADLVPDNYNLRIIPPDDTWFFSAPNQDYDKVYYPTGKVIALNLNGNTTLNVGLYQYAQLIIEVRDDENGSGNINSDPFMPNQPITLTVGNSTSGSITRSLALTTNVNGRVVITNVIPGVNVITVTPELSYEVTAPNNNPFTVNPNLFSGGSDINYVGLYLMKWPVTTNVTINDTPALPPGNFDLSLYLYDHDRQIVAGKDCVLSITNKGATYPCVLNDLEPGQYYILISYQDNSCSDQFSPIQNMPLTDPSNYFTVDVFSQPVIRNYMWTCIP